MKRLTSSLILIAADFNRRSCTELAAVSWSRRDGRRRRSRKASKVGRLELRKRALETQDPRPRTLESGRLGQQDLRDDRGYQSAAKDETRYGLYGDVAPVKDDPKHTWKVYAIDKKNGTILWERVAFEECRK